ncbi:malto-oligosyltrehalose synthase [Terriglobus aquaticus]|uniref:Malto-oligosyltrehalose synthase n=1 Tax=Terriglobus aquaticus TaxID=940139 RepID=A0ABW9KIY7_9BACT|nr:malto-oligosyltrehalose synthase [Terriglobus aquaticus]
MARIPHSTYRLQLHKGFTFDDASAIAPYLRDLGISHVYSSPYLQAGPESMHGYDVVDHHRVNRELGGAEAHERFSKRLGELKLGQVLDIVPNHMSVHRDNRMWWDVLENGPSSRFATFFDIDWNSVEEKLRDKVLMPVLGDQYGRVLAKGEIKLKREGECFLVQYGEQAFPMAPRSLAWPLGRGAALAPSDELNFLASSFARLPEPTSTEREVQLSRHRDKQVLQKLLQRLCKEEPRACAAIDEALEEINNNIDSLDEILSQQNFRLAYWKTSDQELGYRRFFDVNSLIGLRMERQYVFDETHELILYWLEKGLLDGIRIDHPDGLRDPRQYLERLRAKAPEAYIVVEKILEPGEWLRTEWPVEGTSGYDFLNVCNALLVKPDGMEALTAIYRDFTGQPTNFDDITFEKKTNVAKETLASDVNRLTNIFVQICESNREFRDFTRADIRRAIRTVAACFHVYRTYVVATQNEICEDDINHIRQALKEAAERKPDIDPCLFGFIGDVLTLKITGPREAEFVARFQQFTSPVMAKGVEDTAFYDYDRLTSLNEVGGDPSRNGLSVSEFHEYNTHMQQTFPLTMTTLSTHDTKRADDVRARLAVLSELPDRWSQQLQQWSEANRDLRTGNYPDPNTEYFLYQTLIGAWPIDADRTKTYMQKAMNEAKLETSWTNKNEAYENAVASFIDGLFARPAFLDSLKEFVNGINRSGRVNSLTQTLLKCVAPGMPDLYQGGELWDHSLVDPDNRRPVDYKLRAKLLKELQQITPAKFVETVEQRFEDEGSPKLWLTYQALQLRNERPQSFGSKAAYTPLVAQGAAADHVVAFSRGEDVVAVGQRFPQTIAGNWRDTTLELPTGSWTDRLSGARHNGGKIDVANLLDRFPVALLVRDSKN